MRTTFQASDSVLQRWNCANCGRANQTVVSQDRFAQCEYCADTARVRLFVPWLPRVFGFAARLMSSLVGESGCIQWRPVLAPARRWTGVNLTR